MINRFTPNKPDHPNAYRERFNPQFSQLADLTELRNVSWYIHLLARLTAFLFVFTVAFILRIIDTIKSSPIKSDFTKPVTVLLTAGSASENWLKNHLLPLSRSEKCHQIIFIGDEPVSPTEKIRYLCPPHWMKLIFGRTPSRLITYFIFAFRCKPDICGGFHLIPNAVFALIAARLINAQSLYFCVGGRTEFLGGASHNEHFPFGCTGRNDATLEYQLLALIDRFDRIVTMGTGAKKLLQHFEIDSPIEVIPGGIDPKRFIPGSNTPAHDLIITCRLVPVKRLDIFLQVVSLLRKTLPNIRAVIVGNGEERYPLEKIAADLKITDNVWFAGRQDDIPSYLQHSRLFVLTSDSEGLALSLMEAMMCGLPAVVSNVGDLGDLVENGKNGYLVKRRDVHTFAEKIRELLTDENRWKTFSKHARESAMKISLSASTQRWTNFLQVVPETFRALEEQRMEAAKQ
jgi:glycosyltransferase involved in cell wall biosynthesis